MSVFSTILDALPYILQGALVTILLVAGTLFIGLCLGVPMAVTQVYGPRPAAFFIGLYVWFFEAFRSSFCFFYSITGCSDL